MSLDRHAAERRRFARLLGTDGAHGSGLPIGEAGADKEADRNAADDDGSSDDPVTTGPDR
ncbi:MULTISPECIES: hypothetical protein [Natrinema]|uniref:Uncharacterized protein n=1 Tax=Natrinema gari JCM 14663 TaxID=1230459 RepID=L9YTQ7_9EURY|nr:MULTISPECIES: hypothetical protein [Natrinema]AFO59114.1 hypothetical protein NJ7G_3897 [Natrinema sp. J7-2]ELY77499.1 hypothetical protein C486_15384 [Natrinema gari JCM 14663]